MSSQICKIFKQISVILLLTLCHQSYSNIQPQTSATKNFVQQFVINESSYLQDHANISMPSSFRKAGQNSSSTPNTIQQTVIANADKKSEEKQVFKIGLIVPRTAFLSQYKTYTQRIKDTFSHLLQLSRHPHQSRSSQQAKSKVSYNLPNSNAPQAQQTPDNKPSSSSCLSNTSPLLQQNKQSLPWQNLTFNKYFDIKVVDLVNLAPRSSAKDVIDTMCQKLIEQNVSVIIYLENNHDDSVASFEVQPTIPLSTQNSILNGKLESFISTSAANKIIADDNPAQAISSSSSIKEISYKSYPPENPLRKPHESNKLGGGKASAPHMRTSNEVQRASSQAHFIMHLAQSANIPMIAWSVTATLAQRPKKQRTLHLAPTVAHEAEAMLAILQRYSWYSFSVITTTLAGHDDFILALRQSIAVFNNVQSSATSTMSASIINSSSLSSSSPLPPTASSSAQLTNNPSDISADNIINPNSRGYGNEQEISTQPTKAFKLLDVITVKKRTLSAIEEEVRKLTVSESRVILLYSTKGEAIDIFRIAKKLNLTRKSYAWIVAQSVVGPNENERAPTEFHPGLLGIYFRSNHERLLDELSRAITIIAHGLEQIVRDKDIMVRNGTLGDQFSSAFDEQLGSKKMANDRRDHLDIFDGVPNDNISVDKSAYHQRVININRTRSYEHTGPMMNRTILKDFQISLSAHSKCYGDPDNLSRKRADYLYDYFRRSSPSNVFDADGSLKDVQLNVINLGNDRNWRKIGCFSDATLSIDDITWPEQAERPPSGTMDKFHLSAVFLEEPSFVNLAEPDVETGECKTNRAVRCHYKVLRAPQKGQSSVETREGISKNYHSSTIRPEIHHKSDRWSRKGGLNKTGSSTDEFEYKCCSGFCIDLMEKFATDLKFSYDLYRVPDGYWGILENNTWNGLIGEIIRGRADVIVTSIKINSDRQKAVDFTIPFLDTGISILVSKQTGVIAKLAFLEPFDTLAWVMFICVGIPIAAMSIFYFEWLSPNGFYARYGHQVLVCTCNSSELRRQEIDIEREHHRFSFCRTLWLVIAILFGSAAHIDSPKGYTARFMSNVWATFAVVFLAVYTANLAAFMITREEYIEFSGITDSRLAYPYHRHPPLKFGTITGGNTHAVLKTNKPNLYNYMRRFNRANVEDGVDAVRAGHLDAFVYDALVLDYMASQDPECKLVNVGAWYSMTGYALAFPRNSRYYDKFNMKMLDYRKNGELDRLRRFWLQGLCKPGQNRHSISKPLDLSQFMSAFLLLGAGILCSVVVLVFEHLYIIYIRDILIKSRFRERLIRCLYPFSLSLTETLRLPGDDERGYCYKCDKARERRFVSSSDWLESIKSGQSQNYPTLLEMDNLSRRAIGRTSSDRLLDIKIKKLKSRSTEIPSTPQVSPSKVTVVAMAESSSGETKRPCTSDSSNAHVPEISSRQELCPVLDALAACEVSLANEVNRGGSTVDAYKENNDDFKRARSLLKELKRTLHRLSSEPT